MDVQRLEEPWLSFYLNCQNEAKMGRILRLKAEELMKQADEFDMGLKVFIRYMPRLGLENMLVDEDGYLKTVEELNNDSEAKI